jgi:propanol-preferring alcohol dehydrogenase
MFAEAPGAPLRERDVPRPSPLPGRLLIGVEACAVCRTDLHVVDGELPDVPYPVIPGHQIVGRVVAAASSAGGAEAGVEVGARVGVPWLGSTCGRCLYCATGRENLCDLAEFTGYTLPGGYAEYLPADPRFCFPLQESAPAEQVAPLLCAGLIGYRALRMCGDAERIGLFGFGAAAHVLAQVLRYQGREFHAFTRPGDRAAQRSAEALGAHWAGDAGQPPDRPLDAAVIFAPVGELVPMSLAAVAKGGTVVCAGIHMSDIPSFPYALLWGERQVRSVANLTRADGLEFLALAERIPIRTQVHVYPLGEANRALADLRTGAFTGSAVLRVAAA